MACTQRHDLRGAPCQRASLTQFTLVLIDLIILSLFLLEILLKLFAYGCSYLRVCMNAFDALVIVFSFVFALVLIGYDADEVKNIGALGRVLRFRVVLRLMRLLVIANRLRRARAMLDEVRMVACMRP